MIKTGRAGRLLFALVLPISLSGVIHAQGLHLGWCNGVGNKHQPADCGGGGGDLANGTSGPVLVPDANHLPTTSVQTPTPDAVSVVVHSIPTPTVTTVTQLGPAEAMTPSIVIPLQPLSPQVTAGAMPMPVLVPIAVPQLPPTTGTGPIPVARPPQQVSVLVPMLIPQLPVQGGGATGPIAIPPSQGTPKMVPILVPPQPPTTTNGPVPTVVPNPNGPGVGTPILVPSHPRPTNNGPVPVARPPGQGPGQQIPVLVPPLRATPTIMTFVRPKPRPESVKPHTVTNVTKEAIVHVPRSNEQQVTESHVTETVGRQSVHALPQFEDATGGGDWTCLASGLGKRRTLVGTTVDTAGALRHVGNVDVLGRDVPARHPKHAHCLISVQRRQAP